MKSSILKKSELNSNIRIDADYFLPEYLNIDSTLKDKKTIELHHYCNYIKKGIFDISPLRYKHSGIPLIRTTEIKNPLLDFQTTVFIDNSTQSEFINTKLVPRDIVLTKIGAYIGDVAFLPRKYNEYNFSQNVAGLSIKKEKINPEFLLCYLLSKYGNLQIQRAIMLSGQGKIELEDIKKIKIVVFSKKLYSFCTQLVNDMEKCINNSNCIYKETEKILLNEIGLNIWQSSQKHSYIKNYSDVQNANRFDAEYFQPKYDEIIKKITSYPYGYDLIKNQFSQNKDGFEYQSNKEYQYVEIGSINTSNGIITPECLLGDNLPLNAKIKLQRGDVIISKVRTYRGAVTIVENDEYVGSSAFTVLQKKNNGKINKETLYAFFKLKPILDLTLKYNTGTSYPTITDDDIMNIPIPLIRQEIQHKIKEQINQAKLLQNQSKQLLEIAKRGVEIAIEQDETIATDWINNELQKIGVEI